MIEVIINFILIKNTNNNKLKQKQTNKQQQTTKNMQILSSMQWAKDIIYSYPSTGGSFLLETQIVF